MTHVHQHRQPVQTMHIRHALADLLLGLSPAGRLGLSEVAYAQLYLWLLLLDPASPGLVLALATPPSRRVTP